MAKAQNTISILQGILVLLGSFFVGLFITQFLSALCFNGEQTRMALLTNAVIQNVFAFILPALFTGWILTRRPATFTSLANPGFPRAYIGLLVMYLLALPAMNQIVFWNAEMHLPASMSAIEETFRQLEEMNARVGEIMLDTTSLGGMLIGVLVIGCLTGFSEEIFFRGALQNLLEKYGINIHVAIWVAAFVFSAIHFQFFGFIPRLLLGAWFGYLLYWTRSIWVSAVAHAVNNSLVVVTTWFDKTHPGASDFDLFGVTSNGFPWMAIGSAMIFAGALILLRRMFFSHKIS